jgi:hypothetical protein
MNVKREQLVRKFSETVGEERAEQLVRDATEAMGVAGQRVLSKETAMDVADHLASDDDADSLVRVSANTLQTQLRTGDIGD